MSALRYGHNRATWAGSYRDEILSRERPLIVDPWEPYLGRLLVDLPGYALDLTLHQDRRDPRRFRAVDLEGVQRAHAAPRELMRQLAIIVPHYGATK
jgi:hypothetical protein